MKRVMPFVISLGGIMSDFATTTVGLGLGFCEGHLAYHPLNALLVFWGIITVLTFLLPREKPWVMSINSIALTSYLGAFNNALVLLRVFSGLRLS